MTPPDSERRYPIVGVCLRCENEYFDLRRIMGQCTIDGCGGYIAGKTREELREFRERNQGAEGGAHGD